MFILKNPPNIFLDGDIVSPDQINDNNSYFATAFDFVRGRQNARWTGTYSFVPAANLTLNSSTSLSTLTRKFPQTPSSLNPVLIESVDVIAYYTADTPFTLYVGAAGDYERIEFPARAADKANEPYFVTRLLGARLGGQMVLSRPGINDPYVFTNLPLNTSITKFDVTVGFIHNRFNGFDSAPGSPPSLLLPEFTDASTAGASQFTGLKSTLETAATLAQRGSPMRWVTMDVGEITDSTPIGRRSITLPESFFLTPTITPAAAIRGIAIHGIFTNKVVGGTVTASVGVPAYDLTVNITSGTPIDFEASFVPSVAAAPTDFLNIARQLTLTVSAGVILERATVYLILG